jgi:hypothetical protein
MSRSTNKRPASIYSTGPGRLFFDMSSQRHHSATTMIPYYAYKRYKKNQALKETALDKKDEKFLEEVVEKSSPAPDQPTPSVTIDSVFDENKAEWEKEKDHKSEPWGQTLKRWGTLGRTGSSSSVKKVSNYNARYMR